MFNIAILIVNLLTIHVELDTEGTIPPDDDPPQEMGDRSVEVTEDMRDKAQEERQQGS
jgi:suppressor of tumorigenicity protein 13